MDPFIGLIKSFPYGFAPAGWAFCDGRLLQVTQYQALFALIGNKFGGDGRTTFALPDLRGAEPDSSSGGYCCYLIALTGLWPPRS
ncbi:MAG: phage tail protein [Firmicutes bacterium HGW-Firmicutes-8]|nr:MAG: phage tail protein [Firmicutes bacterium HGW-Firmicutes-8]